ncbi:MAG: RNA polymerase sigma-70 factor (ECF subfamily) [Myxococcota bacterium]|jgi:RNA polymerase sigma-70 factor (ECF subfamily)
MRLALMLLWLPMAACVVPKAQAGASPNAERVLLSRRVRQPEVVDDLVQEVFLRVHERAHTVQDADRLAAWVHRVAHNVAMDHLRARRTEPLEGHEPSVAPEPTDGTTEVASWMPLMVAALPERYREAVRLSELEGLSQAEVATRLGLSPSGARTRVQRGRTRLLADLLACCPVRFEGGVVVDTGVNECACGP